MADNNRAREVVVEEVEEMMADGENHDQDEIEDVKMKNLLHQWE